MKKNILVSVDRGETRVATLEAKGAPTKKRKKASPSDEWKVAELYVERRGRRIDELIKPGQEIIVQVVKDPLKTKGARLSMQLSIAGRYLVYMPQGGGVGVSKRLPDGERQRLRKLIEKLHQEDDGGLIVRTAAQGAKKADFEREIDYLHKLNDVLERRSKDAKAPSMVFQEADLSVRVLRDVLRSEFEGAIIDDPKQHSRVTSFFQR